MLQPLASALAVKTMSELYRAVMTAIASPLWSTECSNRVDNDLANLLQPPCLLPTDLCAGGLMSILFWTTFSEGKCINSWSACTLYSAQSSEGASMSHADREPLMHLPETESGGDRTQKWEDSERDLHFCPTVWQRAREPRLRSTRDCWIYWHQCKGASVSFLHSYTGIAICYLINYYLPA